MPLISKTLEVDFGEAAAAVPANSVFYRVVKEDGTNFIARTNAGVAVDPDPVTGNPVGKFEVTLNWNTDWAGEIQWDDNGTRHASRDFKATTTALPAPAVSDYIDYARFLRRWGLKNVTTASNKDDPKTILVAAVQDAFDYADDEVNLAMLGGPYAVPLDFTTNGGVVQPSVESWASIIAYNYIYEGRGWEERLKSANRLSMMIRQTYGAMSLVRAGVRRIKAARHVGVNQGISVIRAQYRRRSRWIAIYCA